MSLRARILFPCLCLTFLLLPSLSWAGFVSGTVVDSLTREPIADALVEIVDSQHALAGQTTTRANGSFVVDQLEPATYEVFVTHIGYRRLHIRSLTLIAGEATVLTLPIAPTVIYETPIVVTVSRVHEKAVEAPASVDVILGETLAQTGALTTAELTRGIAGVDNVTKGIVQEEVVVRGFNSAQSGDLLTLVDYRRARVPSLRFNVNYFIPTPTLDIEQIEVVRGPGAALYGPSCDRGVLHMLTRSPFQTPSNSVELGVGERGIGIGAFRLAKDFGDVLAFKLTGQYTRGDDWVTVDSVEARNRQTAIAGGADPNTLRIGMRDERVERAAAEGRIDWRAGPNTTLIGAAGFNLAKSNIDLTQIGAVQVKDWKSGYLQGRIRHHRLFGNAYLNLNEAGDSFLLRTGEYLIDRSRELGAEIQHGLKPGPLTDLIYGLDFLWTNPRTGGTITGRNEDDDDMKELGAYAQFDADIRKRWNLVGAMRVDWNDRFRDLVVSPRAALVFAADAANTIRLTYNRAFATPVTDDLFVDILADQAGPYGVRAIGVPETGFSFRRDCGGPCMRSPFTPPSMGGPSAYLPPDATLFWDAIIQVLNAEGAGIPALPAPDASQVSSVLANLNPETGGFDRATGVTDVPALGRRITNSIELGYKGRLGHRLQLGVDGYVTKVNNFIGPLQVETPNVFLDPVTLRAYLESLGISGDQLDNLTAAMSSVPSGTITPQEARDPYDIMLMVRNFGDVTIWGMDFATMLLLTNNLWLDGAYSYVSDNFFSFPQTGNLLSTNSPRNKGSLALVYQSVESGPFGELGGRWVESFPVVSGVYDGKVASYGLVDLTLGYRFRGFTHLWISLTVSNLLDHRHQQFIGAPEIGRLALLKARADF